MKERLEHHYRTLLSGCDGHHYFNKKIKELVAGAPTGSAQAAEQTVQWMIRLYYDAVHPWDPDELDRDRDRGRRTFPIDLTKPLVRHVLIFNHSKNISAI